MISVVKQIVTHRSFHIKETKQEKSSHMSQYSHKHILKNPYINEYGSRVEKKKARALLMKPVTLINNDAMSTNACTRSSLVR